jgi:hypothetical protein
MSWICCWGCMCHNIDEEIDVEAPMAAALEASDPGQV